MRGMIIRSLTIALVTSIMPHTAGAQDSADKRLNEAGVAISRAREAEQARQAAEQARKERLIDISIGFNFSMPLPIGDVTAQAKALEGMRKMTYEFAGRECEVLKATIAHSCSLERMNITTNANRQGNVDIATINGQANYKIGLKPADK